MTHHAMWWPKTWPSHWIDYQCVGDSRVLLVSAEYVPGYSSRQSPMVVIVDDKDGGCRMVAEPWTLGGAWQAFATAIEEEVRRQEERMSRTATRDGKFSLGATSADAGVTLEVKFTFAKGSSLSDVKPIVEQATQGLQERLLYEFLKHSPWNGELVEVGS